MWLDAALASFHAAHEIFINLGVQSGFCIPKLHFLLHYIHFIKLFGTTNNYNTEATEQLHINFTKDAYCVTNHRDEYPQMIKWLKQCKKMLYHSNYMLWHLQQAKIGPTTLSAHQGVHWEPLDLVCHLHTKMMKHPSHKAIRIEHTYFNLY